MGPDHTQWCGIDGPFHDDVPSNIALSQGKRVLSGGFWGIYNIPFVQTKPYQTAELRVYAP